MTGAHTQRAHARLAPSAAHRWMNCPGSVKASEGIEDKLSPYAAEGTAAHEFAAHCLAKGYDPVRFIGHVIDVEAKNPGEMFGNKGLADGVRRHEVTDEMAEGVMLYVDYVRNLVDTEDVEFDIEQRLDMTHVHPSMFGTGDALVYRPKESALHLVDLKFGRGVVVSPEENAQLLTYALGAVTRYGNRPIDTVHLTIIQPRAYHPEGPIRTWITDPVTIVEFEDRLSELARATEADDAPLAPGDWCRFCPAAPTCPAKKDQMMETAKRLYEVVELEQPVDKDEMGALLTKTREVADWIKSFEQYAFEQAEVGKLPTGYKLVKKRPTRKWKDEDTVADKLSALGFDDSVIFAEPKVRTVAQMEKALGKNKDEIQFLYEKVSSGNKLVPVEDGGAPAAPATANYTPYEVDDG